VDAAEICWRRPQAPASAESTPMTPTSVSAPQRPQTGCLAQAEPMFVSGGVEKSSDNSTLSLSTTPKTTQSSQTQTQIDFPQDLPSSGETRCVLWTARRGQRRLRPRRVRVRVRVRVGVRVSAWVGAKGRVCQATERCERRWRRPRRLKKCVHGALKKAKKIFITSALERAPFSRETALPFQRVHEQADSADSARPGRVTGT